MGLLYTVISTKSIYKLHNVISVFLLILYIVISVQVCYNTHQVIDENLYNLDIWSGGGCSAPMYGDTVRIKGVICINIDLVFALLVLVAILEIIKYIKK